MGLTVGELLKQLEGVPPETTVYVGGEVADEVTVSPLEKGRFYVNVTNRGLDQAEGEADYLERGGDFGDDAADA